MILCVAYDRNLYLGSALQTQTVLEYYGAAGCITVVHSRFHHIHKPIHHGDESRTSHSSVLRAMRWNSVTLVLRRVVCLGCGCVIDGMEPRPTNAMGLK